MEEIKIGCIKLHKLFSILRFNFQNGAKTLNRNRLGGENRMCLQKDLGFIVVKESLLVFGWGKSNVPSKRPWPYCS